MTIATRSASALASTPEPAWHATSTPAHVDPHSRSTHAAHAAPEHLKDVADVDSTWHATFAEVEPLHALTHVAVFIKSILVLLSTLFSIWQDVVGLIQLPQLFVRY